jgi:hypothetical protein
MSARIVVSSELGSLAFNKRNKEAQANQLVKREMEGSLNATGNKCKEANIPFSPLEESKSL